MERCTVTLFDLGKLFCTVRAFSSDEILAIARGLFRSVAEMHAKGVMHRDIKPSNVMIRKCGEVVLGDFGLARVDPLGLGDNAGTCLSDVVVAKRVRDPALILHKGVACCKAVDVWAMAQTIYWLITGEFMFDCDLEETKYDVLLGEVFQTLGLPDSMRDAAARRLRTEPGVIEAVKE